MKKLYLAAAAASIVVPCTAFADGHEGGEGGPPEGLPPAILTTINLSQAGLLLPFYANPQKGLTGIRAGANGVRIGTAGATGVTDGYEHNMLTIIPSLSGSKLIQDGSAYLTFELGTNLTDDRASATEASTQIPGFSIGYANFSNPNSAWSINATFEDRTTELANAPVETGTTSVEFRFAYVRKLSDNWGIGNQTYLTFGESYVEDPGGRTEEDETEFFTQFELVGSFGPDQVGFVPEGWKFHPTFGISYNHLTVKDASGNKVKTEDGSIWAKAVLSKDLNPGGWTPNVTLGVEHVYQSDAGVQFINEDTYGIIGVGALFVGEQGNFNVALEHRAGFNGNRRENLIVAGYSFDF